MVVHLVGYTVGCTFIVEYDWSVVDHLNFSMAKGGFHNSCKLLAQDEPAKDELAAEISPLIGMFRRSIMNRIKTLAALTAAVMLSAGCPTVNTAAPALSGGII